MQTYQQTFAGAQTWTLNVAGSYFTTLGTTLGVNVRLYRGGKKLDLGDMVGLLAGLEIGPLTPTDNFPFAFDRVEIDVAGADNIKVGIGNGAARYNRSNGTVDVNSLPQTAILQLIRPELQTGSFNDVSVLVANTPITVFTPAANVNGAVLLSAEICAVDAAGQVQAFVTKASAPASPADGSMLLAARCTAMNASLLSFSGQLPKEQIIAPGLGLYFISNAALAAGANNQRAARFRLL